MRFAGSFVALVTPFKNDGGLDEAALRRLVRSHLRAGTAGLVPCGSTGEAATLTHEEYRRVVTLTVEESRGLLPVVAGVGTNATAKAVALAREAEGLGADALLVVAPYYNKPTQDGLYQHFRAVARATRLPIVAYNIPAEPRSIFCPRPCCASYETAPTWSRSRRLRAASTRSARLWPAHPRTSRSFRATIA